MYGVMKRILSKKLPLGLNLYDILLLTFSAVALTVSFFLQSGEKNILSLITSLCGTVGILFIAKGMLLGQYLTAVYGALYLVLSFFSGYYGECILILITVLPSCVVSIILWRKHPAEEKGKVQVNRLKKREYVLLFVGIAVITALSYFVLYALHTKELLVSTLSFVTSLGAAYLLARRSPYYAVFYLLNDVVLIVLWSLAVAAGENVLPNVVCFVIFLFNDSYGLYNWLRRQNS